MSALNTFTTLLLTTDEAILTGERQIVNDAAKRTYLISRALRGREPIIEMISGGDRISDITLLDAPTTAEFYHPNDTLTASMPQTHQKWTADWRFLADHITTEKREVQLQMGADKAKVYKKLIFAKKQRLWTSLMAKADGAASTIPEAVDMESATGKLPYSLFAFINEYTNGLFYSGTVPTGKTAWTTVEGINPATYTNWVPPLRRYTGNTATSAVGIIATFDDMWKDVRFIAPRMKGEYFESDEMYRQVILCSSRGHSIYANHLRELNQNLISPQDPAYNGPTYSGIPVEYWQDLDTAVAYPNDTGTSPTVTELSGSAEDKGPRYYWVNFNYIRPVWHPDNYMAPSEPITHPNQPFTSVVWYDSSCQWICRSRKRNGLVAPGGDMYTA